MIQEQYKIINYSYYSRIQANSIYDRTYQSLWILATDNNILTEKWIQMQDQLGGHFIVKKHLNQTKELWPRRRCGNPTKTHEVISHIENNDADALRRSTRCILWWRNDKSNYQSRCLVTTLTSQNDQSTVTHDLRTKQGTNNQHAVYVWQVSITQYHQSNYW